MPTVTILLWADEIYTPQLQGVLDEVADILGLGCVIDVGNEEGRVLLNDGHFANLRLNGLRLVGNGADMLE